MDTSFYMPTPIHAGPGCYAMLAQYRHLGTRPLILCGARSARESGALAEVQKQVPEAVILDAFPENPDTATCEACAASAREAGADWIIGLGGGSVLDGAKAIALLARNGGRCADYFETTDVTVLPLPVVAVPTTAGTGSETTPYAVLVDTDTRKKKTLKHPSLFPRAALLDPTFTCSLPPETTVATGLDALSQAMEGRLSRRATPIGDVLALDVCRRVRHDLPRVVADPGDRAARASMMHAAMLSGIIIAQSGTTLVHGMGYYYTLDFGVPHGAANALLLPPVFQINARHDPRNVAALAGALGHPCAPTPEDAGRAIVEALHGLYARIGFSPAATDHGVPECEAPRMAADIIDEPYRFKNQLGQWDRETVERLFVASCRGDRSNVAG